MKKLVIYSALLFSLSAQSAEIVMPIRGVADGDTIRSTVKLPCPLCNVSVRIRGIDTPETSHLAKCPLEKEKGLAAKSHLKLLIDGHDTMVVRDVKWDKYGGRVDGQVIVNGVNIGDSLISKGFAKPYTGEGPKPDWCS